VPECDVAAELFLRWISESYPRRLQPAVEVRPLLPPPDDGAWISAVSRLEEQVTNAIPARIALWAPFGAGLPAGEPAMSQFIDHVRAVAVALGPHERSYVHLPITLRLRKAADSGGVVSVTGGLNPHWARFTERVIGTYDLDSTRLHRLPESDEQLEQLLDAVVERAAALEVGRVAEIETIDAWTVQRLDGDVGLTLIARPPAAAEDVGLAVRRNLRLILTEAGQELRARQADLRALVLLGHYARMEQEGATTAMRGYDPAVYAGLDFVCLVADGLVKPLIAPATEPG